MPSSRASSQPRDRTLPLIFPALTGEFFTTSATWEIPKPTGVPLIPPTPPALPFFPSIPETLHHLLFLECNSSRRTTGSLRPTIPLPGLCSFLLFQSHFAVSLKTLLTLQEDVASHSQEVAEQGLDAPSLEDSLSSNSMLSLSTAPALVPGMPTPPNATIKRGQALPGQSLPPCPGLSQDWVFPGSHDTSLGCNMSESLSDGAPPLTWGRSVSTLEVSTECAKPEHLDTWHFCPLIWQQPPGLSLGNSLAYISPWGFGQPNTSTRPQPVQ